MNYQILIKKLREKLILTQTELAQTLGVSYISINRWENGHCNPTTKVKRRIVALCKENGVIVDGQD
ncbi:MAG: helix-turn-helix domain-containing protein [Bacilli bacterium]|jgi:DNA-binding XRE family transcriptional regulator|nr:helix-turn-helix domain-containing protein [Bacilli bacterium]